jgi:large subunit ribosomal protein L24
MKAKLKIRRDDTVIVIAGKHKGRVGKVVRVMPLEGRVVVEGVARVKRHVKAQGEQAGSLIEKEAPIHVSNVALWNAEQGRKVKVGYQIADDGTKTRVDRKTGTPV